MIEIKEDQIEFILSEAIREASDDMQLISVTKKIDETDPLAFFEASKHTGKDRIFWTSTAEDFYIVGVGNAYEIAADESRFSITEDHWDALLRKAIIHNPYQTPGTGMLTLGGMSFDPKRERSDLWENYDPSRFIIPEFMLTKHKDIYYFTINIQVKKNDHPVQLANELSRMEMQLLNTSMKIPEGAGIKAKQEISPKAWKDSVHLAMEEIKQNETEKIVLARELRLKLTKEAEITAIIDELIQAQSNSYVFAFERGEDCFIGATPERLVKVEKNQLLSTCLAGTAPRGKTKEEDARISATLLHDEKNREEHDFVVQMIKQAIENYCTDIVIPNEPVIYPLKNLQHLYTPVTATLKDKYSIFDIIEQLHPTPALGGTPTKESLAFIREHEKLDRGWYGAPIGWLDSNQNGEFAVAIRSGLIQGDEASLFAGCGVVKDSDVEEEYEETNTKFLPMLSVFQGE